VTPAGVRALGDDGRGSGQSSGADRNGRWQMADGR
jgi:hypothetical protein